MRNEKMFLFIGPTSFGMSLSEVLPSETLVLPPVRRGDIQALIEKEKASTVIIVDGTYHTYPAVSHVEIKNALQKNWKVWGLSSMGAIRAAEMHELGMQGYGTVFKRYIDDEDLPDDYVALVHGSDSPWFPISEPLIHIDFLLQQALRESIISHEFYQVLMDDLKNMWFGYRTIEYIKEKSKLFFDGHNPQLNEMLNEIKKYRIKSFDVIDFFHEKPFLQ